MTLKARYEKLDDIKFKREQATARLTELKKTIDTASGEDLVKINADVEKQTAAIDELVKDQAGLEGEIRGLEASSVVHAAHDAAAASRAAAKTKALVNSGGDYLKSSKAMEDFAQVLMSNVGAERSEVNAAWAAKLQENGITNPELLFPEPVITAIQDTFGDSGSIFATFHKKSGFNKWKTAWNKETGPDSRARGHQRGNKKKEQVITLEDREIASQYVYKYLTIDKEVLRETQSTRAIINYVLEELPQRIVEEIERSAIVGDGRETGDDDKIKSFIPIATDTSPWVAQVTGTGDLYVDVLDALSKISERGTKYLVTSRSALTSFKTAKDSTGRLMFQPGTPWKDILEVSNIFTPDWYPTGPSDPVAIVYVGEAYYIVGDNVIENYDNFILAENKHEFLAELYTGGGICELEGAAVITQGDEGKK